MHKITCEGFIIDFLSDYLDGSLNSEKVAELEEHLARCGPCVAYMNTLRKTQELIGQAARVEMPAEMKTILRRFLLERLAEDKS